jgi:pimeloyl-ACP methyl ester carboxylesterase
MEIIEGLYINAGDTALFTKISGEGYPAIVIEPSLGGLSAEWSGIQSELSKYTAVISYDRAGYAESKGSKKPRTTSNIIDELKQMLDHTGLRPPFIFVGNSFGGLIVQHFCRRYPGYAWAVVLADSITTDYYAFERLNTPEYNQRLSLEARMGFLRQYAELEQEQFDSLIVPLLSNLYTDLPDAVRLQLISYQSDQGLYKTILREFESLKESSIQTAAEGVFPDIPLCVITRDKDVMAELSASLGIPREEAGLVEEEWYRQSESLLSLSPRSYLRYAEGSDHNMQFSAADIVTEEALKLLSSYGQVLEIG